MSDRTPMHACPNCGFELYPGKITAEYVEPDGCRRRGPGGKITRRWALRGTRPRAPRDRGYQYDLLGRNGEEGHLSGLLLGEISRPTKTDQGCSSWCEVNGIKLLFGTHNEWTRLQVHQFAEAAYGHIEGS